MWRARKVTPEGGLQLLQQQQQKSYSHIPRPSLSSSHQVIASCISFFSFTCQTKWLQCFPKWRVLGESARQWDPAAQPGSRTALLLEACLADMVSPVTVVKSEGPKLVPFFKATCVYFVLWLPTSSPSWFSALIKCLPIFCLWVFLLAHGINFLVAHRSASRILAGLIFSAVGDAFLIWQEQGYFVHGLLMFAITHILYSSAFGMKPLDLKAGLVMTLVSSFCYTFLYAYLSGPFTYLVAVYIALIGFMGWRAIAGVQLCNDLWTWTKLSACIGAVLFMVSDLTIAVNKFCFPVPYSRAIIMATYYAAQMLIALSAVESRDEDDFRKRN
ncbi:lysoplasmalogenase TMEM86A isoform X1 [Pelodiscus sinensis]